jgi:hypothetical protein
MTKTRAEITQDITSDDGEPLWVLRKISEGGMCFSVKTLGDLADAWEREREDHFGELNRLEDIIERYRSGVIKTTNNNMEQLVSSRDHWKSKCELERIRAKELNIDRDRISRDRDGWADRCSELTTENVELRSKLDDCEEKRTALKAGFDNAIARLDASITSPVDANGVPCKLSDKMADAREKEFVICGYMQITFKTPRIYLFGSTTDKAYDPLTCHHVYPKPELIDASGDRLEVGMWRWDTGYEDTVQVVGFAGDTAICKLSNGKYVKTLAEDLCRCKPKTETIEDLRSVAKKADETFSDEFQETHSVSNLVERSYKCGKRDAPKSAVVKVTPVVKVIRTSGGDAS